MPGAQTSTLIRPFYPALDGLRAVAFLMVFGVHYVTMASPWRIWGWGWMGVDLFFVLSGFLITGILYDSIHRNDFFKNFYTRRALRIFPLFYGFWLALLLVTPLVHFVLNRYNLAMALYVGNVFIAGSRLGLHVDPGLVGFISTRHGGELRYLSLGHLWSLCVEEQFYLLWPAVVWFVRSRRTLLLLCVAVMSVLPFARGVYIHRHPEVLSAGAVYHGSWTRVDTLLCGAALALWLRGNAPSPAVLRRSAMIVLGVAPAVLIAALYSSHRPVGASQLNPIVSTIGFTAIALASAAALLLCLDPAAPLARVLQAKPLLYLGRISYGLYFFHELPAIWFFVKAEATSPRFRFLFPLGAFAYTLAISVLSFRFFETPFLRLKSVLAPRAQAANQPPPAQ